MTTNPIQTRHVYPPIPDRRWDWAAYRDPERRAGQGPTVAAAVLDLLEWENDEDDAWTEEERCLFTQGSPK